MSRLPVTCLLMAIAIPACLANEEYRDLDFEKIAQSQLNDRLARGDKPVYCDRIGFLDNGLVVDGWSFYFERDTKKVISACGGACMIVRDSQRSACANLCPPPEWRKNNCSAPK